MDAFQYVWQYLKKYQLSYIFALFLVLITSSLVLVNPYIAREIVDKIFLTGNYDFKLLLELLTLMCATVIFRSLIRYYFTYVFENTSQNVMLKMRMDIYTKLQELDFEFYDNNKTGDLMSKMTGDLDMVRHFVAWVLFTSFEQAFVFIIGIGAIFFINWRFALIQLILVPVLFYFANKLANTVRPTFYNIRAQFSKLNSVTQENISGNRVVKAFAKEDYEIKKFATANESFYQANIESSKVWQKYLPPIITLGGMFSVNLILVGGILVINGTITLGELVMANGLIWTLSNPVNLSGWLINDWQRFFASISKIRELMDVEPKIQTSDNAVTKKSFKGKVEFNKVYFKYEQQQTLKNISFKAHPGQTVAIIGPTGSGKSTLVNLICRFYDVTGGEVKIDDVDVREIDVRRLRENVSVAQQDIFLFSDTIEGNIAYGVPHATFEDVVRVAKIADAHDFILNTPDGYDTIVGERGMGLSGGQKQRVALARALLKNPSILILDDTTSSVDMETEHEIHSTLRSYYTDKTTFIIAHRISSVKNANLILVLNNGEIIEQGTHDELVALGGQYYQVFVNQYGDFNNGGEL